MKAISQKRVCVDDIIEIMEDVAPLQLAEDWDNCGLQVGYAGWPVHKIWVALDPLLSVVRAAGQNHVDLVITHHPLIFKPLSRIDLGTAVGETIATALNNHTAIYAAHTNLDSVCGGINDVLARKIGLTHLVPLIPNLILDDEADSVDAQPMGLGRIGKLEPPVTVGQLARRIKTGFKLDRVKVAGRHDRKVRSVAVCSGSGGGLLESFLNSDADVFISGDLKYHDARVVEDAGRALIDVGHFASEHLMVEPLVEQLAALIQSNDWRIEIEACPLERDPFDLI